MEREIRITEGRRSRKKEPPSAVSLPKWPQFLELSHSKTWSQDQPPSLPQGCMVPRFAISRELDEEWSNWDVNRCSHEKLLPAR